MAGLFELKPEERQELRAHIAGLCGSGGDLMETAKRVVNRLAPMLAERYPDVAKQNPKHIGQAAKFIVVGMMVEAVYEGDEYRSRILDLATLLDGEAVQ